MTITIAELKKLSVAERIQLAEDLWDSVVEQAPEVYQLTAEQEAELERRLTAHDADPGAAIAWSDVRANLFQRKS